MVTGVRRSGLTFAPEAGSNRLRKVINKTISNENLLDIVKIAFSKGWTHIKLYFMIGLPTETDKDISELIDLAKECLAEAKKIRKDAKIHLGISTFVPKPWTPFQWERQISIQEIQEKQQKILNELKKFKNIKISFHSPESSFIEGIISRADRTIGKIIYLAWQKGAYLETSSDHIKLEHWLNAIDELSVDPHILLGERKIEEPLPWDFIDMGIRKEWLISEREKAFHEIITSDCREGKCHQCGIHNYTKSPCLKWEKEKNYAEINYAVNNNINSTFKKEPKQRLLIKIGKIGTARLLSHLEFYTAWIRILRRAELPLAYSQGFHAHPKISFALPAPVGEIVLEEFMEIWLTENVNIDNNLLIKINNQLPEGFVLHHINTIPINAPSLMQRVKALEYIVFIKDKPETHYKLIHYLRETFENQWDNTYSHLTLSNHIQSLQNTPIQQLKTFEIQTLDEITYIRWISPIINNKFLKPSILIDILSKNLSQSRILSVRTHTYLDVIPTLQTSSFSLNYIINYI